MAPLGKKKAPAAKKALSLRHSNMTQGLLDDFDGEITGADFRVHVFKEGNDPALVAAIVITTEEGTEHTEYLPLGRTALENFRPSVDGIEPIDENGDIADMRGDFIVPISDRAKLAGGSNFGVFMKSIEDLQVEVDDAISSLVGTYGHFNRVEQPEFKGRGIVVETEESKNRGPRRVLCLTEVKDKPKAGKKAAPAAAKGKAAKAEPEGDDLQTALSEAVVEALESAKNGVLSKTKIASIAMKLSTDAKEKKALVELAGDDDFLSGIEGASYDADDETLTKD